jgi:uncharacterized protein (TIGR00369 family)
VSSILDEPVRGAIGDLRAFQRPGLETMRRYVKGELPGFPISRLLGLKPSEAGLGKATFSMPLSRWLEDGFGQYWAGVYALFADAPLAAAIWTTLPRGKTLATSELYLSFLRPMSRQTRNVVGRAQTIHTSTQLGLSTLEITDQDGRMLAFGTTRCVVSDVPIDPHAELPAPDTGPTDPPDPYLRPPPERGYLTRDEILNGRPIELQRKTFDSNHAFPVWSFTGLRPTLVEDGRFHATIPTSRWLSNGGPALYGGLLAWAADFAMGASVYSTLGPGDVFATLDLHVRFLRPVPLDSGDLTVRGEVRHRGRRLQVATCDLDTADGKRVAMATSSVMLVPGGMRELMKGRMPDEILATTDPGETRTDR